MFAVVCFHVFIIFALCLCIVLHESTKGHNWWFGWFEILLANLSPYPKFSRFTTTKNPHPRTFLQAPQTVLQLREYHCPGDSVRPRLDAIIVGMEDIGHVTNYDGIWWNVMERTVSTHLGNSWIRHPSKKKRQRSNPSQNKSCSLYYM